MARTLRSVAPILVVLTGLPGCASESGSGSGGGSEHGTTDGDTTTTGTSTGSDTGGATTSTATGSTNTGESSTTSDFVPCQPLGCDDGDVGCPCATGDTCNAPATCEFGRCIEARDDMVFVPGGRYCMGCNDSLDPGCVADELPAHEVELGPFLIDRTEVTQAAYDACVQAGACPVPDDESGCINKWDPVTLSDHPVVCIGHDGARGYCEWADKQLPTEAQWEMAARGPRGLTYPWGQADPTCALTNYGPPEGECVDATDPVGRYPDGASPYGALDMSGNAWERVGDWYRPDWYERSDPVDPAGPATGSARVVRGGSFTSVAKFQRTAARDGSRAPWVTARNVGFRCAMPAG